MRRHVSACRLAADQIERDPAGGVIGHCAVSRELSYVYDPWTPLEAVQIDTGVRQRREPWAPGWYRLWQ